MGRVLAGYEPAKVMEYFEDICGIPHPSFHEEQISNYLVDFAKARNLTYFQDDVYNVVIIKEATPDRVDHDPIVLQGHIDMVAEQDLDCMKNMMTEGLDLEVADGWISAKGTTLGADNGIAVAMAMALLDDNEMSHPRLECIFTTCEEVTMGGVARVDVTPIRGKKFLNLDSEEEGVITCGCAGGAKVSMTLDLNHTEKPMKELAGRPFQVDVTGLKGGHSGADIDKNRANANLLFAEMFSEIYEKEPFGLISINGGSKVNAIPRYASAVLVGTDNVRKMVEDAAKAEMAKWAEDEPGISITVSDISMPGDMAVCTEPTQLFDMMLRVPNGLKAMSQTIEGAIQTSSNLGVLVYSTYALNPTEHVQKGVAAIKMQPRSSVAKELDELLGQMAVVADEFGGTLAIGSRYPAWEYVENSEMRESFAALYKEMTGKDAVITVTHGGLECGLFSEKILGLDAISVGPEMMDVHSPSERLSIESTERIYNILREFISRA